MVSLWQPIIKIILFIITIGFKETQNESLENPDDWRSIEKLAEKHPYIVALLNGTKDYTCTGTIISKKTILTSGNCINLQPLYITVATAIIGNKMNYNNIFKVNHTEIHGDYIFEFKTNNPNVTKMHSNLGLVFSAQPVLELYVMPAEIGNYFAPELKEKKLTAVGFGKISDLATVVLQKQEYHEMPCTNPKWYYCVCGIENSALTYTQEFGEGAPVLLGDEVVGVTASPCGVLSIKNEGINYNIFTVIAPYLQWIQTADMKPTIYFRSSNSGGKEVQNICITCILLFISKVVN